MDKFIYQTNVSREYPFSLTTIHRWRRDGTLTTYRQGKRRVLLLRAELNALVSAKEKVGVGSTDEENVIKAEKSLSRCKDNHFSPNKKLIIVNNEINGEKK